MRAVLIRMKEKLSTSKGKHPLVGILLVALSLMAFLVVLAICMILVRFFMR